jgi:hypothetical protein
MSQFESGAFTCTIGARSPLLVDCQKFNCLRRIASCSSIASACAPFTIYFDLIPHTLHIGSIVVASTEYVELAGKFLQAIRQG